MLSWPQSCWLLAMFSGQCRVTHWDSQLHHRPARATPAAAANIQGHRENMRTDGSTDWDAVTRDTRRYQRHTKLELLQRAGRWEEGGDVLCTMYSDLDHPLKSHWAHLSSQTILHPCSPASLTRCYLLQNSASNSRIIRIICCLADVFTSMKTCGPQATNWSQQNIGVTRKLFCNSEEWARPDGGKQFFLFSIVGIDTIIVDRLDQANHSQVPMIHDIDISEIIESYDTITSVGK